MPISKRRTQVGALAASIVKMWTGGLREPREVNTIDGVHEELCEGYRTVPDNGSVLHVDTSPTGAGKTTASNEMVQRQNQEGKTTMTLEATHQNCQETVTQRREAGIPSAAYPRLDEESCRRYKDIAKDIYDSALSVPKVLCPDCYCREGCTYREESAAARESPNKVATHARAIVSLPVLTRGCDGLIIDEDPRSILRPIYSLPNFVCKEGQRPNNELEHPLVVVGRIYDQAAAVATDPYDRGFYRHCAVIARYFDRQHHAAFETVEVNLPRVPNHTPPEFDSDVWHALCDVSPAHRPPREAMELVMLAAMGKLSRLVVVKNEYLDKSGDEKWRYVLTGVGRTELPGGLPTVAISYTMDLDGLAGMTDRPLHSLTPPGADTLPLVNPVTQIAWYDVTKGWKLDHAADVLRGILYDLPHRRVGVLTHKNLCDAGLLDALGEPFTERVHRMSYFGNGLARGSNQWLECDALVLFATPRPDNPSIREWLVWYGYIQAARLTEKQADWHAETWTGTTTSGEPITITTKRYRNEYWYRAYTDICKMQLMQAIGRGRGILRSGIPVYFVSTEDIGSGSDRRLKPQTGRYLLADPEQTPFAPLKLSDLQVLAVLDGSSKFNPVKTAEVVERLGMPPTDRARRKVNHVLDRLKDDRRVCYQYAGKGRGRLKNRKKGWYIAPARRGTSPDAARRSE